MLCFREYGTTGSTMAMGQTEAGLWIIGVLYASVLVNYEGQQMGSMDDRRCYDVISPESWGNVEWKARQL